MISEECERPAEVDFHIAEVSRYAVREKSIRHGHSSTLRLWWARRPPVSSRAVLMALLPGPCDPQCMGPAGGGGGEPGSAAPRCSVPRRRRPRPRRYWTPRNRHPPSSISKT